MDWTTCQACGEEIAGGDDSVAKLPSPVSSFHHFWHLRCCDMAAVAAEREACAKIAEARTKDAEYGTWQAQEGLIIAADIRARSNSK
jgi:hypothetical protein